MQRSNEMAGWRSRTAQLLGRVLSVVMLCSVERLAQAEADDELRPQPRQVPLEAFYEVLREHGTFIDTDRYGVAFCPHPDLVGADFQPYRRGHWVMTEYGWTFTSDLKISWVTDHYGRWVEAGLSNCAWAWVPGGEWGPAWVDFRVGEKVVAWRPLPYQGPKVRLRLPESRSFPRFNLPEVPPSDSAYVVVREGEFQAKRLDYVALSGVQQFHALRETEPVRDLRAGLHSYEYDVLVARRERDRQRQLASQDTSGRPPTGSAAAARQTGGGHSDGSEPAQRRRKGDPATAAAAGTVRAGLPGAELPKNPAAREKQLVGGQTGDNPPSRTSASTGSSAGNPGDFSGVKVLDWGKPKPVEPPKTTVRDLNRTLSPPPPPKPVTAPTP
ncbi:MAG: hypothetical protein JNM83_12765 [Myxococcales bacterium]|nr:hypothetical protein [Myxococcales bacterium]